MSIITLKLPSEDMKAKALNFKNEFFANGERTIYGSYKFDMDKCTYLEWLQIIRDNLRESTSNPKFGTSHTFFAVQDDEKIIGIINFRHKLTDFYKDSGHIGYSIRPSERKKGYGTDMLRRILGFAYKQGLFEIYLVCRKDNDASRRTIIKNGGKLNRTFIKEENEYNEYIICLS